jgi:hypothetical protein
MSETCPKCGGCYTDEAWKQHQHNPELCQGDAAWEYAEKIRVAWDRPHNSDTSTRYAAEKKAEETRAWYATHLRAFAKQDRTRLGTSLQPIKEIFGLIAACRCEDEDILSPQEQVVWLVGKQKSLARAGREALAEILADHHIPSALEDAARAVVRIAKTYDAEVATSTPTYDIEDVLKVIDALAAALTGYMDKNGG